MSGNKRLGFTLVALATIASQVIILPVMPVRAISPAAYDGPPAADDFTYGTNTTYFYNYTYTISKTVGSPYTEKRWIPTLSNRTLLDASGQIYEQEFKILNETYGTSLANSKIVDDFGNEYYYFELSVPGGTSWTLNVQANLTMRDITWKPRDDVNMSSYNTADPFYTRYTKAEEYINKSFPLIYNNATLLNSTNPFKTAQRVYNFVTNLLTYHVQTEENGAEWAIVHKQGDCTEFSYLMVAMLRACGIPARVLRGLVIATASTQGVRPNFNAAVGTSWKFESILQSGDLISDTLPGHAWVEYFIPGTGWITADPTWSDSANYTSRVDNIHVPYTVGVWIGSGIVPALPGTTPTENVSTWPYPIYVGESGVGHAMHYEFTVVRQELAPTILDFIIDFVMKNPLIVLGIVGFILVVAIISYAVKRGRKKKYSDNGSYRGRVNFNE
jgi:transglutaminase-like putative cysteine protease